MEIDAIMEKIATVHAWYQRVEVAPGIFTPGWSDCRAVLEKLELPEDCTGLRALDLGAGDGFFAIMLEKRGAKEVIAIDHVPAEKTGFPVLKEIFGSNVRYIQDNVYNVSREKYGQFDIVLCLGLLYHLRNPLLVLDKIRDVCKAELYVESFCIDNHFVQPEGSSVGLASLSEKLLQSPVMQFYPGGELNSDCSNWWGPNSACLQKMLESTNFTVLSLQVDGARAILKCRVNEDQPTLYHRGIEKGLVEYRY